MQEYEITKDEVRDPQGIRFWQDIKGRDGCRLPFPWDSKLTNQGFNSGTKPWLPVVTNCHWIKQKQTQEVLFMFFKKCCKYAKNSQHFKMEVIEKYYWMEIVLFLKGKQEVKPC